MTVFWAITTVSQIQHAAMTSPAQTTFVHTIYDSRRLLHHDLPLCKSAAMPREDARLTARLVDFAADITDSVPRIKSNGFLETPLDQQKHKNFIYPLPNPTTAAFSTLEFGLNSLDPVDFYTLNSSLVHWDPQLYFNHCGIQFNCPLCGRKAHSEAEDQQYQTHLRSPGHHIPGWTSLRVQEVSW